MTMAARTTTVGLMLLCALAFSAASAPSAMAKGTTAYTCVFEAGKGEFEDADCSKNVGAGKGNFQHVAITPGAEPEIKDSLISKSFILKGKTVGVNVTIECLETQGSGKITNAVKGEEMVNTGSGLTFTFSKCTVTEPAGKGCEVKGGGFTTKTLKSTTEEMEVKFSAEVGNVVAEFTLQKCSVPALNKTYKAEGTFIGIPNGSFLQFTAKSTEKTEVELVPLKMEAEFTQQKPGAGGNPIAYTT
jgi:hypothetical protein